MRKLAVFIAVVAIAFAAAVYADDKCIKMEFSCADDGDYCIGDFLTNATACFNESKCCSYPLYCINSTCQEDSRDMACTSSEDCIPALFGTHLIACIKNKCVVQGSFNDSCTKNDHCYGSQICVNGQCDGLNESSECEPAVDGYGFQCGANFTCVDGVCKAPIALGQKCKRDAECDVYSICNDGKCTERYSVKFNESCDHEEVSCEKGLYCDMTVGRCMHTVPRKYIECNSDSDCSSYGNTSVCQECDARFGKKFCSDPVDVERDCIAEISAAFKCYRKNGCAPTPSTSLDTCAQLECTAETNAIFTCQSMCEDRKRVSGAKCLSGIMLRYCPLLPTWLRIVIAFSILIVIIVVVFIFYGIYRCCSKSEYVEVPSSEQPTRG